MGVITKKEIANLKVGDKMEMQIRETYEYQTLELDESKKKKGVLGVLKGPSFFEDRPSRNKRKYKDCWKPALSRENTKRMLEDGLMFGTVGHADVDVDALIRDRKVSHRTAKLKLGEDGIGYGEFELLDTPLGKFIHTAAKSGSKFAVSSKAIGEAKGKDNEGNEIVDPTTFRLERFDIVIDPGFLSAQPKLMEQLNEAYENKSKGFEISLDESKGEIKFINKKEEKTMSSDMNEKLTEKILTEKLELEKEVDRLSKDLSVSEAKATITEGVEKDRDKAKSELEILTEELRQYKEFFNSVGKPEKVQEALESAKTLLEVYTELGSVDDIEKALTAAKSYKEDHRDLGSTEVIAQALEGAKCMGERIEAHGGIDKIEQALDEAFTYINKINKENITEDVASLSAKYGVAEDKIEVMVETMGMEKAEGVLEDLKVSESTSLPQTRITEDKDKPNTMEKGRLGRMIEATSGREAIKN